MEIEGYDQVAENVSLRATGFFRLWTAESISLAGTQVTAFALPLVAVIALDASAWEMGLLTAANSAAALAFGLSAGALSDRYERRGVMLVANAARAVVLLLIPGLYFLDMLSLYAMAAVSFTVAGLSLLFDSAMASYTPRLVGKHNLAQANSWMQGTVSVGEVAGPGFAGLLVQVFGAPLTLLLDSASYLVSSLNLAKMPKAAPERTEGEKPEPHFKAVLSGLRLLRGDRFQRPLVLGAAHFNFFTAMFFTLYTLYVIKVLGFSSLLFGVLTMIGGVSGLLGAALAARIGRKFGVGATLVTVFAFPGVTGLLVPAAISVNKPVAMLFIGISAFFWSFAVVINLILSETIKQALVPDMYLGRVTSAFRFVATGVEPFGALVGGALATSSFGITRTLVLAAIGLMASAFWPLISDVRTLRDITDHVDVQAVGAGGPGPGPHEGEGR
ncbi:MFS transporter [Streptomyces sp. AM2-3-1]|uniref:MFS transporter n=1 Tax=Streptomyces sp. AM2-3-1 TaxID=3075824 RepID=UPI0028C4DA03|nr:MFS transporter [Streptomyces sp. AM2-3-1]WNO67450.1 MFS transporter [Streptomyces sp. AM2-3-1]